MEFSGADSGGWALRIAQAWALIATVALVLVLQMQRGEVSMRGEPMMVHVQQQPQTCQLETRQTIHEGG